MIDLSNRMVTGPKTRCTSTVTMYALTLLGVLITSAAPVTADQTLFQDGFETGIVPPWSSANNMVLDSSTVHTGLQAARTTSSVAWAERKLGSSSFDVSVVVWFKLVQRSSTVWLTRLRTASGISRLRVYLTGTGALAYRNEVTGQNRISTVKVPIGVWHQLTVHAAIGTAGSVEVSLDGVVVPGLSLAESLGTVAVGRVEIGNRPTGRSYSLVYDDVHVSDLTPLTEPLTPPQALTAAEVGADHVTLSWTAPVTGPAPTNYGVFRDNIRIATVLANTTSFTDNDVRDHDAMSYAVTAENSTGEISPPSNFVQVRTPGFDPDVDAVVLIGGDIACLSTDAVTATSCQHHATADILQQQPADAILMLGDAQYLIGSYSQFLDGYAPSWGRPGLLAMTHPVPGNHEYNTAGAAGYFQYFGATPAGVPEGNSSFDIAGWHLIGLNSNCSQASVGGCDVNSTQYAWLVTDLASHAVPCSLAFWHHPRWSSGLHGADTDMEPLWALLYSVSTDLVMAGHDHSYERFEPLGPSSGITPIPDSAGIRSFVVGTGGRDLRAITTPILGSAAHLNTFGVLKLTLHAAGYDWRFVPVWGGQFTDSGSGTCH